jgi:AcrR family transcriptional regulator
MATRDPDRSPSKRAKKSPAKKPKGGAEIGAAVITAAERLFRDRSPANVTVREIEDEAGVQQSLVYRYFRTKENLLASVFYPQARLIQTAFVEAPDDVAALRELRYEHQAPGYARALAWAVLEGADLELLFTPRHDSTGRRGGRS